MRFLTIYFVICLFGVALSIPSRSVLSFSLARGSKNLNYGLGVVGAKLTPIKKLPFQAAIFSDDYLVGAGAVIGKQFILTTNYVVEGLSNLKVRVGSAKAFKGGQLLTVEKTITHEKYSNYSYDVVLLKLKKRIKYSKTVKPIQLASNEGENATSAVISGYGYTFRYAQGDYGKLQSGKKDLIDTASCQTFYSDIQLDESNYCAYNSIVCACYSDFGDPLVQNNKLLGVFIGGSVCCYERKPQIFNSVPAFYEWAKEQMKTEGYDDIENMSHYYSE